MRIWDEIHSKYICLPGTTGGGGIGIDCCCSKNGVEGGEVGNVGVVGSSCGVDWSGWDDWDDWDENEPSPVGWDDWGKKGSLASWQVDIVEGNAVICWIFQSYRNHDAFNLGRITVGCCWGSKVLWGAEDVEVVEDKFGEEKGEEKGVVVVEEEEEKPIPSLCPVPSSSPNGTYFVPRLKTSTVIDIGLKC